MLEYLKTIDINVFSLNEIILNLEKKFSESFENKREEIEEALVGLNFESCSENEDVDLELAKQLQEQERRHSNRKPTKKRKLTTSSTEKPKAKGTVKSGAFHRPLLVSEVLADIIGEERCSRPEVVKLLWKYIKENNLQDPSDRRFILCDEKLLKIFKKKRVSSFGMNQDISRHLTKIESNDVDDYRVDKVLEVHSTDFVEKTVNVPFEWNDKGLSKKSLTYHELQLEIIRKLRSYRDPLDPDIIQRPTDDSIIVELMGSSENTSCRTSDILRNLRAKFQSQIGS